jgi:hypothetical protein
MDPYLEGSHWTSVHTQLSVEIARQLAPKLRPRYLAFATKRFVMDVYEDVSVTTSHIYPDVGVAERGGVAVAPKERSITAAPLRLVTEMPDLVPHVNVEIRDTANQRLVTSIEVLSPTNKRGEGYEEYLAKRRQLLLSTAHLMEIDLLRQGQRVPMRQPLPTTPYFVFLSRADCRPYVEVWPIALTDPLPTVPIPLLADDPDVPLDLQLALTTVYDVAGYDLACDYSRPPEVPLPPELATWAEERVRAFRSRS